MPEVNQGIATDTAHGELAFGKRREQGHKLRTRRYDRSIILPRSFKAALVPWFANIPVRTGFRGEMRFGLVNDVRNLDKRILDQTVKKFVALGRPADGHVDKLPQPSLRVSKDNQSTAMDRLHLQAGKPAVALMPGAEYGPAKCWPLEYFASLATALTEWGYSVWVLGSESDQAAGRFIADNSAARSLCGHTSLADVIDLLAYCQHAVTNDSGLMHVAAAVGTHVHVLYGSSSPDYTPPLTERKTIHYRRLDCSPCFERQCPLGHLNCLRKMRPETVLEAISPPD
jgi:heptosyltransferase-2